MATTPGQTAPTAFPDTAGPPAPAEYPDTSGLPFYYFTTKARHIYTKPRYENNSYIIFGSEPKGLDETLLRRNTDQCVRLPMRPGARSLNLSNTVAVAVFEVLRQWDFPELQLTSRDLATSPTPR
ncbi:MAG: hypothetical protein FWH33_06235 [Oscillospiraceae bacterium]|nr:hypothetical protein [Oscillospiraceae bacterium]